MAQVILSAVGQQVGGGVGRVIGATIGRAIDDRAIAGGTSTSRRRAACSKVSSPPVSAQSAR